MHAIQLSLICSRLCRRRRISCWFPKHVGEDWLYSTCEQGIPLRQETMERVGQRRRLTVDWRRKEEEEEGEVEVVESMIWFPWVTIARQQWLTEERWMDGFIDV